MSFCDDHRCAARRHAQHRFWQRYGIAIAEPDLAEMERQIAAGKAKLMGEPRSGGRAWRVKWRGQLAIAVYNDDLGCIVTFLPKRAFREFSAGTAA